MPQNPSESLSENHKSFSQSIVINPKETLLIGALRQGVMLPNNCRVGSCGKCKCQLLSGSVKELTDKSYTLNENELAQGFILACQSIPKTDLVIAVDLKRQAINSLASNSSTLEK